MENTVANTQQGQAPSIVKPFENRFAGTIEAKDIIMPLAILLQGNPTEREKYPNGQPKTFINNITQQVLPPVFIPILTRKEWVRFNPKDDADPDFDAAYAPNEVIWKLINPDPNDPKLLAEGQWRGTKEEPIPPLATEFIKVIGYFPGFNLPVMISFSKTGYKAGKTLLTSILATQGEKEQMYRLQIITKTEKGNTWYTPSAINIGDAKDEDAAKAKAMYEMISAARSVEVHDEGAANQ